jgi:FAD/FMN-containing dehydrogenase
MTGEGTRRGNMDRRDFLRRTLTAGAAAGLAGSPGWPGFALAAAAPAELVARRVDGDAVTLTGAMIRELGGALRGELLVPGDAGYDQHRRVWNGMIDKRPALIARCVSAVDVRHAVDFARQHLLLVSIKGGGHSISGKAACDGGLMIDLSAMRGVRVDPVARTARVEPGVLLGELDREALAFGLVTTAGTVSHTGAAGLTLGGGFGRTGRKFGLTCDNLRAADVITADGRFLRASAEENPDLHWGLRGGGGNFGVVTSFEYQLHPMNPQVLGGTVAFPLAQARDVLGQYAEFCAESPDELNTDWTLIAPSGRMPMVQLEACYVGEPGLGEAWIRRLGSFGKPVANRMRLMDYLKLQRRIDPTVPHGQQYYMKSGFLVDLPRAAVDTLVDAFRPSDTMTQVVTFQQLGGAIGRVPQTATAFSHRDAGFALLVMSGWTDPASSPAHVAAVREYWQRLEPFTTGFYVNSITADDEPKVRANYRDNYDRLVAVKTAYDPGNLFRLNANVKPAPRGA